MPMKLNIAGNKLCQRDVFFRSLINSSGILFVKRLIAASGVCLTPKGRMKGMKITINR